MGAVVWSSTHGRVDLVHPLAEGGEGVIYDCPSDTSYVCKVYHPHILADRAQAIGQKLPLMVATPPEDPMAPKGYPIFAWPKDLLYDPSHKSKLVGFVMPRLQDASCVHKLYSARDREAMRSAVDPASGNPYPTFTILATTAMNLAIATDLLHVRRYVMVDVNENNLCARPNGTVAFFDNDSFQVHDRRTGRYVLQELGRTEYWPPPSLKRRALHQPQPESHDCFALGIFVFRLLMEGYHPYHTGAPAGVDQFTWEDNIATGTFAYDSSYTGGLSLPRYHPPYAEVVPPPMRGMFLRCFTEGVRDTDRCPSARDWVRVLRDWNARLKTCSRGHTYYDHASSCPWCALDTVRAICTKCWCKFSAQRDRCPNCGQPRTHGSRPGVQTVLGSRRRQPPQPGTSTQPPGQTTPISTPATMPITARPGQTPVSQPHPNPTGTPAGGASTVAPPAGPTAPTGYTAAKAVTHIRSVWKRAVAILTRVPRAITATPPYTPASMPVVGVLGGLGGVLGALAANAEQCQQRAAATKLRLTWVGLGVPLTAWLVSSGEGGLGELTLLMLAQPAAWMVALLGGTLLTTVGGLYILVCLGALMHRTWELVQEHRAPAGSALGRRAQPAWKLGLVYSGILVIATIGASVIRDPQAVVAVVMQGATSIGGISRPEDEPPPEPAGARLWCHKCGDGRPLPAGNSVCQEHGPDSVSDRPPWPLVCPTCGRSYRDDGAHEICEDCEPPTRLVQNADR